MNTTKRTIFQKVIVLIAFAFVWMPSQAKDENENGTEEHDFITIKYCDSYEDLENDNWQTADSVWLVTKSRSSQYWSGGGDYNFKSDNEDVKNHLKKKAIAVMYNDTLLINARLYNVSSGYARGYRMVDGRLVFEYFPKDKLSFVVVTGAGVTGGLMGGVMTGLMNEDVVLQNVCYLVTPGKRSVVIIGKKEMKELLKDHPDLLAEYKTLKRKYMRDADIVLVLLRDANLLKGKIWL